jgi:predicted regulator of Ras-like GTPase activity (Roadblock/LC7/MglB family)
VNIIVVNSRLLCADELGRNLLEWVYFPGDHGDVMFTSIGEETVLTT